MIEGLLGLLACQLVGELAARTLHLALPGPVIGMLLLLLVLTVHGRRVRAAGAEPAESHVMHAGDRILDELPLLFIPAGVGVMTCFDMLRAQWLPVSVAFVVSWVAGLLATSTAAALVNRGPRIADTAGNTPTDEETRTLLEAADELAGLDEEDLDTVQPHGAHDRADGGRPRGVAHPLGATRAGDDPGDPSAADAAAPGTTGTTGTNSTNSTEGPTR